MIRWEQYYELGDPWHGFDNYQCLLCPFSTIDGVAAILAHVQTHKIEESDSFVLGAAESEDPADEEE